MLIPHLGFRFFKIKKKDGYWLHIPNRVYEDADLNAILERVDYSDAYFSSSTWLNPLEKVKGSSWKNYMLYQNLYFDLDNVNKEEVLKLLKIIDNKFPLLRRFYILKTNENTDGTANYQVFYDDELREEAKQLELTGEDRETFYNKKRKELYEEVSKEVKICNIYDTSRVLRIPNSKRENGFTTCLLNENLNPLVLKGREGRPKANDMGNGFTPFSKVHTGCERTSQISPIKQKYISNSFKKAYVPYLRYDGKKYFQIKKELDYLQNTYKLGDAYIIENEKWVSALFLKLLQRRRLNKINSVSSASNKRQLKKFRKQFIVTSERIDSEKNVVLEKPKLIGIKKGPLTGQISEYHKNYVNYLMDLPYEQMEVYEGRWFTK